MNEIRNKRKAEIEVLFESIKQGEEKYFNELHEAKKANIETLKQFLPKLRSLELETFTVEDWYGDERKRYEISFKGAATFSIAIEEKKIISYSVSGISSHRNIEQDELRSVEDFYFDSSTLLCFFRKEETLGSFSKLGETLKKPKRSDYVNPKLDEHALGVELNKIEREERIEKLDLKEGSIVQYLFEDKRGSRFCRSSWIIVKIKKITPKKFVYVQYSLYDKKWLDENGSRFCETMATLDYDKIKELDDEQKELIKEGTK